MEFENSFDTGFENIEINEPDTSDFDKLYDKKDEEDDKDADTSEDDKDEEDATEDGNGSEQAEDESGEETDEEAEESATDFLLGQLEAAGIPFDPEDFKEVKYESREEAIVEFKRMTALSIAKAVDPVYEELIDNGIPLEDYLQAIQVQKDYLAKPDKELVHGALYSDAYSRLLSTGAIKPNEKGELSPAHQEKVKKASERALEDYDEQEISEYAKNVRAHLQEQIKGTPEKIAKAREAQIEENWARAEKNTEKFIEAFETAPAIKTAISSISNAQYDSKEFGEYTKKMLSPTVSKALGKDHTLMIKLKEDPVFLSQTLMLLYQHDKGLLKQIEKKTKTETAKKIFDIGGGKKTTGGNNKDEEKRYQEILKR